jgi:HD-like signal output (HDOD) protein
MSGSMLSIEGFEQKALATGSQFPFGSRILEYLVELVNDPRATASRLSAVVAWNPMLARSVAAQLSTAYGFPGHVRDVDLAVAALGSPKLRETLKRTVSSIATRHMVHSFSSCPELWNHLLACALVSRAIARRRGNIDPVHAFIAGLVHDIGFLFLEVDLPSPEAVRFPEWTVSSDTGERDRATKSALHEEAGTWMVGRWETLPGEVHDAVRFHHTPGDAQANPVLAAVVHLADVMCHRFFDGPLGQWPSLDPHPSALAILDIPGVIPGGEQNAMDALQSEILGDLPALALKVTVLRECLISRVEDLAETERLVLALHYCEGISIRAIAGVLEVSSEDVLGVHDAAMRNLEAVLNDLGEEL